MAEKEHFLPVRGLIEYIKNIERHLAVLPINDTTINRLLKTPENKLLALCMTGKGFENVGNISVFYFSLVWHSKLSICAIHAPRSRTEYYVERKKSQGV